MNPSFLFQIHFCTLQKRRRVRADYDNKSTQVFETGGFPVPKPLKSFARSSNSAFPETSILRFLVALTRIPLKRRLKKFNFPGRYGENFYNRQKNVINIMEVFQALV